MFRTIISTHCSILDDFSIDGKKSRVEMKWDYKKMSADGIIDNIESFVFKYLVPVTVNGNSSRMPWTTEISPSTGKFITDCGKMDQNTAYNIRFYVRYKDHVGPDSSKAEDRLFIDTTSDRTLLDPNDEFDKSLWYLTSFNTTTLNSVGSNILGFYGYDMRKGGSEFNPDGLVSGAFLDMNLLMASNPNAVRVVMLDTTEVFHDEVTKENISEYISSARTSSKWDMSFLSTKDNTWGFMTDGISKIGAKKGDDGKEKKNDTTMDFANGLSCLINSTVSSLLGLIAGSDQYSSASKTKKFDKSIAGRFSYVRQVRREYIDPQYWSVEAMKPFMNKYFLKDLNNDKISPEEIFNRYGTHVILDLIMGGKMIVDYSSYEASSYYPSDFSNAAEELMSGSSSSYSSVSNFLNSNSDLKVHVWGGVGATAVVNTLLEYAKAVNNWSKTVYNPKNASSNIVFIDAPDLLRKQGSLTGAWNFASEGNVERRNEIMLAYSRYLMESSYEVSSMINGLDRYLSDIVFESFGSDRDSSYWATNKFNEKLYDSGRFDDDFAFIKSFEGSNGNPAKFGKGIYGAGVYTYDEDKALKGVMVTDSNSGDNSFGAHAKMIMEYFGLSDSDGNADYPIVHITLPQALLVCNMLTAAYNEVHDEKLSFAYAYDLAYEVDDGYVVKTLDTGGEIHRIIHRHRSCASEFHGLQVA
ncbi:MAG TPA: hypothetical protein DCO86_00250 [Spirochaetaceae bacterium]|nr:hypothetical protein [Spirochaetaceae bacterium]